MLHRRHLLSFSAALGLAGLAAPLHPARAQSAAANATQFVTQAGNQLVAIINGPGSAQQKRDALTKVVDKTVDVNGIAQFCLGRYWRQASAEQKKRYLELFRQVLVTNITAKLGEYQGVKFTVGRAMPDGENEKVATVVNRPNNPPTNVDWVIENSASNPQIVDVIAEGTSLRLTQRSDYTSYLTHNGNSIDALIAAMQKQVQQNEATG